MNISLNTNSSYTYNSFSNVTMQSISKTDESETSQKVLGYEVDSKGYFKSDFNKAAGIPEDFKIHSDTMKSLIKVRTTQNHFMASYKDIDIAKTAGNAYKILAQLVDKDVLSKDSFTREDIASMPQGYEYNTKNLQISKIYKSTAEYMAATGEKRTENQNITTTFYNRSVMNYWNTPTGGKLNKATNILNSNSGGKEDLGSKMYFDTTKDKYTDAEGSVSKGGLLVGIINKNLNVVEGDATFIGRLSGLDRSMSSSEFQKQISLLSMQYDYDFGNITDEELSKMPEHLRDTVEFFQKIQMGLTGHKGPTYNKNKDEVIDIKSPIDYLYEQMKEDEKAALKNLQKKAKEAQLEEQTEKQKTLQIKLLEELRAKSNQSLDDFTNRFLQIQEKINKANLLQNQVNVTENELKSAFLGMFDFDNNKSNKKSYLDLMA